MLLEKFCESQWEKLNFKYIQKKEMLLVVAFGRCFCSIRQLIRPLCVESHFLLSLTEAIPSLQVSVILNLSTKRNNE